MAKRVFEEEIMAKHPLTYDKDTGVHRSIGWDEHHDDCDAIHIDQHPAVKNAIYEENARLFEQGMNTKNSLGLLGTIPIEDYLMIQQSYPELKTMKGEDRKFFWRTFFQEKENRKFLANKALLKTGGHGGNRV